MKQAILAGSIALALSACSTTKTATAPAAAPVVPVVEAPRQSTSSDPYTARSENIEIRREQQATRAVEAAPEWMSKLPRSDRAVYANGTAVSPDMGMADEKAKMMAMGKICMAAGGEVNRSGRVYRSDQGDFSAETSELAIRSMCRRVDVSGAEVVEVKRIAEGARFRTYMLVALPLGDANRVTSERRLNRLNREAEIRSKQAFDELDKQAPVEAVPPGELQSQDVKPVEPKVEVIPVVPAPVTAPVVSVEPAEAQTTAVQ